MDFSTQRPTDASYLDNSEFDPPASLLNLPWIDCHNHAHTLSWEDRERYALSGCRAMVMVASGYHWTPYKPVRADDVRFLWDDLINRRPAIQRDHFFDTNLALGIHTGVRIENPDKLLDAMREYCGLDSVVAVGETGVTPSQHVERWELDEQRAVVKTQMELADEYDLPVILHTPAAQVNASPYYRDGVGVPGFEINGSLAENPVLTGDDPALEAVKVDVDIARDTGLKEEQIVASHADPNNAEYLLKETDCYLSFTIGYPWLTGVSPEDVAAVVREYGPERIMVDTDCANVLHTDVFSIKRAILELYRLGLSEDTIKRIVLENPREAFGIGGTA